MLSILEAGPDVLAMVHKSLLPDELAREIEAAAGGLLGKAVCWSAFDARFRTSPWRAAKQMLQADPAAPLPQAPVS